MLTRDAPTQELFLGRQPILDRKQNLAAFELLFRAGHFNGAKIEDDVFATATVINHAFTELDIEQVLGKYPGFINLSAPLLMSEVIELLPANKVVLEILETVTVTDALVARCKQLKAMGFTLALDDFQGADREYTALLDVVDIIKVDVQQLDWAFLQETTRRLQRFGRRLLAEKVDSRTQAEQCMELGYELFQGYFFAKPSIITARRLSRAESALMRLLRVLLGGRKDEVDVVLQEHPELQASLLHLAQVVTVGDSYNAPGARRPQRWFPLLIYMVSSAPGAEFPSPLLILAATRGKLMELLARALRPEDREFQERAFLTGTLSLVNALLAMRLSEIVETLPVAADVRAALLTHEGELGALLGVVQALEEAQLTAIERALARVPALNHSIVIGLQVEAMRWANLIGEEAPIAS